MVKDCRFSTQLILALIIKIVKTIEKTTFFNVFLLFQSIKIPYGLFGFFLLPTQLLCLMFEFVFLYFIMFICDLWLMTFYIANIYYFILMQAWYIKWLISPRRIYIICYDSAYYNYIFNGNISVYHNTYRKIQKM